MAYTQVIEDYINDIADIAEEDQTLYYRKWLIADARRNLSPANREKIEKYAQESLTTAYVGQREVNLFAPFRYQFSALRVITPQQIAVLCLIALACGAGFYFLHIGMVVVLIALVTLIYLSDLLLSLVLSARTLSASSEERIAENVVHALADAQWPSYTILCPLYREVEVVPQFVSAMLALDYPLDKLQILFLTEEDDVSTRKALESMHLPVHFAIITVPDGKPRTKPRACNYGLLKATGDYVVIYDAEDIPDPLQLKKAVLAFANQGEQTACVQAKLNFYNANQNILTRWFTAEYSLWFDLTLPGLQKLGVPLPLGGTSNHFRASLLRELGAWDAFNVTEDCDLGLRMANYGFKTAILDSTTYEEANSQFRNWIRQRSRWIKGYMQTYLVYMRHPLNYLRQGRLTEFLSLQLFVGGKTGVLLVNPLMWALLIIYLILRPVELYHTLFPGPILYMAVACLIFGNFFYTYSHFIGCMKREQYGLVKWTLPIFLYWVMASVAAFMALQQLIFKPHYWEKTKHGLHLSKQSANAGVTIITEETLAGTLSEEGDDFEFVATRRSANLSMASEDFELEVTEKRTRIKVHTNPGMQAVRMTPVPEAKTVASLPSPSEDLSNLPVTPLPELEFFVDEEE